MIRGGCLCGNVRFEFEKADGPFEFCHCNRCRKVTGAASMPALCVRVEDFRYLSGRKTIKTFEAPILRKPPAYRSAFCPTCGSPVPLPYENNPFIDVPAGLLDNDPGVLPARHIFVEHLAPWDRLTDDLPKLTREDVLKQRGISVP